jgi:ankyrin repeat protein
MTNLKIEQKFKIKTKIKTKIKKPDMADVFSFIFPNINSKSISLCSFVLTETRKSYIKTAWQREFVYSAIENNDLKTVIQAKYNTVYSYDTIKNIVIKGCITMLRILIEQKELNYRLIADAFRHACEEGLIGIVRLLLGYKTFDFSEYFRSALLTAAEKGFAGVLNLLLADKHLEPSYGFEIISHAALFGNTEIVRILLSDPRITFYRDHDKNMAIIHAAEKGYTEIVRLLLVDKRSNPSYLANSAIINASHYGHIEIVRMLLADTRVNPSAEYNLAIRMAASHGHTETVQLLLADKRVDPAGNCNDAIIRASENGHVDIVRLLLADKRVNPSGPLAHENAVILAARAGHTEIVRLLLADKRTQVRSDNAALSLASEFGYTEIVLLLLIDKRIDPSYKDNAALKYAMHNCHSDVVRLLLLDPRVDPDDFKKELKQLIEKNKRITQIIDAFAEVKRLKF